MCGIFGFVTKSGDGPDVARLKRIARATETRGRHAFGLAWERDGMIKTFKRPGAASDRLADLNRVGGSMAVIGHCRWATSGSPDENANNHPHPAGRGWLVHNGIVENHLELIERFDLDVRTECDSEVIGMLMARGRGTVLARAAQARGKVEGTMALLGIWTNPVRLLILRSGRPLHFGEDGRGFYFASLAPAVPGHVSMLKDEKAYTLAPKGGELWMESIDLPEAGGADLRIFPEGF